MTIRVRETEPAIYLTQGELSRYRQEYEQFLRHYAGPRPTLEEFIRGQQKLESPSAPIKGE